MNKQKNITASDIVDMLVEYVEVLGSSPVSLSNLFATGLSNEEIYTKLQDAVRTNTPLDKDLSPLT